METSHFFVAALHFASHVSEQVGHLHYVLVGGSVPAPFVQRN
jgi:hypothetical protein